KVCRGSCSRTHRARSPEAFVLPRRPRRERVRPLTQRAPARSERGRSSPFVFVCFWGLVASCGPASNAPHGAVAPVAAPPPRGSPAAPAKSAPPPEHCEYVVSAPSEAPFVVHVHARCDGGNVTGFSTTEPRTAPFVAHAEPPGAGTSPHVALAPHVAS